MTSPGSLKGVPVFTWATSKEAQSTKLRTQTILSSREHMKIIKSVVLFRLNTPLAILRATGALSSHKHCTFNCVDRTITD